VGSRSEPTLLLKAGLQLRNIINQNRVLCNEKIAFCVPEIHCIHHYAGDAREESYYDSLKDLFTDFPLDKGRKTKVTILPKQTEAGNPDFRVWMAIILSLVILKPNSPNKS
jgi:hypothetical protein